MLNDDIKAHVALLAEDPFNPLINFVLATMYDSVGQTASAVSFYLRTAEYGESTRPDLVYTSLMKIGLCLQHQGDRNWNVGNSFMQAIQYNPGRPEAYYLMSKFFEKAGQWRECHTYAELCLQNADKELEPLLVGVGYNGKYAGLFQKAIASWWTGRAEESKELFLELGMYKNMDEAHRQAVLDNYKNIGLSMDRIAVILPTRDGGTGRSQRLIKCLNSWARMTEGLSDVHVILDDDDLHNFGFLFDRKERVHIHVRPANLSLMEKLNSVAVDVAHMYKYLSFVGDDIEIKTPWESRFIDYLSSVPAGLVHANTLDLPDHIDWGTHPCITSNLVKALGFYGCPAVEHNFFDNFWNDICKEFGAVKYIPEIIMDHRKPGWTPDFLYHKVTGMLEQDREKYNRYRDTQFASDLEKVRTLFDVR